MADPRRIVIAGDVIDDIVVVPDAAIRRDTDTPSSIRFRAGGSAANTAAWLGSIGGSVDFVGVVGAPDLGRHSELLERHGVRAHLRGDAELPTGTIIVLVEGEQRAMLTERGANAIFDPDDVTDSLLEGAAVLLLTGHTLSGQTSAVSIRALISRARALGVEVAVSPGSAGHIADSGVDAFLHAFEGATILLPSLDEGTVITGAETPGAVASALLEIAPLVVMTMGGDGIVVATGSELTHVEVERVTAVDPTGAGDAFSAGFLDEWVRSGDPVAAARAGALVAARSVLIVGGRP